MSSWKVTSRPCDRAACGASSTSRLPRPCAMSTSQGPVAGPNCCASASRVGRGQVAYRVQAEVGGASARSWHRSPTTRRWGGHPAPRTSSGRSAGRRRPACRTRWPAWPAACSRRSRPCRPAAWRPGSAAGARARIASGSSSSIPRNASSQPSTSTTAPDSRSTAMTSAETASYASRSTGRNTAPGQQPGRRPQRLAGVHAVRAGLVGGRAHHAALGRVAVTADDHGLARAARDGAAPRPRR